ncbi:MAG: DoxX family membrane protein [Kineosporiaceae bacterium]|nr:DoxX family membrane protein [Aeromicrobium sp.]
MSTFARTPHDHNVNDGGNTDSGGAATTNALSTSARQALALLRIAFGLTFLWAFVDKLFGLGFATKAADSWLNGGSPTEGFLKFGAKGPFKGFYNSLAGDTWVNVAFMVALLAIGAALTLGIGMRLAAIGGAIMYVMMWTVALLPENNPVIDDHILGAITVVVLALTMAGNTWGFGRMWSNTPLVKKYPLLK